MNNERPEMPNGELPNMPEQNSEALTLNGTSSNKEFKISGISNIFSGVTKYEG